MSDNRHLSLRSRLARLVVLLGVALGLVSAAPALAATAPPAAPTGLAVGIASGGFPWLVWADNSNDETGFEIERCMSGPTCVLTPVGTTPANVYLYSDQGATIAPWTYRVRAVNAAGASAWTTSTLPTGLGIPVAVQSVTPLSGTAPLLVTGDGSASYGIDFSMLSTWSWSFGDGATASGKVVQHTYTTPGTYRVTLTVTDTAGASSLAETRVTVSPPPVVVSAPQGLTATGGKRRVDLRWTNASGTTTTELRVFRCQGSTCTSFTQVATLSPTAVGWADTDVRSSTTYRYLVTAVDVPAGVSATAGSVSARTR